MATAATTSMFAHQHSGLDSPYSPQLPRRESSIMSRNGGLIGSIRHKFSKKQSSTSDNMNPYESQPKNSSPATRRPTPGSRPTPWQQKPSEPPPAYSAAPNPAPSPTTTPAPAPAPTSPQIQTADDAYAFLRTFDTIFLIDDSGSMSGSRWRETSAAIARIAPICTTHDADGIDIHFLNHPIAFPNITRAATVQEIFQSVRPSGGTPTGQRLNSLLKTYLKTYAAAPDTTKPINLICITDGEPSDDVESPLISAAKKLDRLDAPAWQVGVQFFQVGRDEVAKTHLKLLDDELADIAGDAELRDIVDTVPFTSAEGGELTGQGILKVVLGAVTRRLDRRSKELHR